MQERTSKPCLCVAGRMAKEGSFCFRYRSFLPIILAGLGLSALWGFRYPFNSPMIDSVWGIATLIVGLAGVAVRALTIGFAADHTSGRNRHGHIAESLNATGMYSVVRNPLYLGNFLLGAAVALAIQSPLIFIVYVAAFVLMYERIIHSEELFLREKFGDVYEAWLHATPVLIPRWSQWRAPESVFNWRKVLREEYRALFMLLLCLTLIESATESVVSKSLHPPDFYWLCIFAFGLAQFLVLRVLSKATPLLRDPVSIAAPTV